MAKHLTKCILELGGKSPMIVDEGCDLNWAANWALFGRFMNAGQTCIAPDYLLVHWDIHESFKAELLRQYD